MIPMRLLVAVASLLPLAWAECSKPCMSRCARALLDPIRGMSQTEACLAFLEKGEASTVPVELQDVCRSNRAYSRACSCIGVSATVSPYSSATTRTPLVSTPTSQSGTPGSSTPPGSSNTPSSSNTPISSTASATSNTSVSSATPVSSNSPISSATAVSTTIPESSIAPALSTTPSSSATPESSTTPVPSTTTIAAPIPSEFFDITVYVEGDSTPHDTSFRATSSGYALGWNVSPTVPGKLGIEPGTGRLYAQIDGSTNKLWGSTGLPLRGSLVLSFWTPAQIAAYGGSIVYVKCDRDADGYVTCGYEDQDLARLKPTDNKNVVLGKHAMTSSTAISMLQYPLPAGYPTVKLLLK